MVNSASGIALRFLRVEFVCFACVGFGASLMTLVFCLHCSNF